MPSFVKWPEMADFFSRANSHVTSVFGPQKTFEVRNTCDVSKIEWVSCKFGDSKTL